MGRILSLSCFMGNAGSQYSFHILPHVAWRERGRSSNKPSISKWSNDNIYKGGSPSIYSQTASNGANSK